MADWGWSRGGGHGVRAVATDENAAPALMAGRASVKSEGLIAARVPFGGASSKENATSLGGGALKASGKAALQPLGASSSKQQQQHPVVAPRRALGDITNKGSAAPAGQGSAPSKGLQKPAPLQQVQQPIKPITANAPPVLAARNGPAAPRLTTAAPAGPTARAAEVSAAPKKATFWDSLPPPERLAGKGWEQLEAERQRRAHQAVQQRVNMCCAALATSLQGCWDPTESSSSLEEPLVSLPPSPPPLPLHHRMVKQQMQREHQQRAPQPPLDDNTDELLLLPDSPLAAHVPELARSSKRF